MDCCCRMTTEDGERSRHGMLIPADPRIAAFVARLNDDEREFFEERVAFAECEDGLARPDMTRPVYAGAHLSATPTSRSVRHRKRSLETWWNGKCPRADEPDL